MLFYIFKKTFRPDFKNRRKISPSSPVSLVTYQPTTAPAECNLSTTYSHFPTNKPISEIHDSSGTYQTYQGCR